MTDFLWMLLHSWAWILMAFFPTCQVRVIRFYHSCFPPPSSPPPLPPPPPRAPPPLHPLPCPLSPCQLFANFRAQCALLDLNCRPLIWVGTAGPQPQGSERSGHRWTSTRDIPSPVGTWDLQSSVRTTGPQPGTFLSGHCWTSTAS